MNPVIWFEIPVKDLDRAKEFYEHVFGHTLTLQEMGPARMAFFPMSDQQVPGAGGSLIKSDGYVPSRDGTLVYFHVPDIDATLKKVGDKGGRTLMPKTSIGEYGVIAHLEDCEGNRIGLHSME